jgi:Family of unknown function (DUF5678)
MPARDWSELFEQYKGKWVALADDRMTAITSGDSRREVKEKAFELGHAKPLVLKFPDKLTAFVG